MLKRIFQVFFVLSILLTMLNCSGNEENKETRNNPAGRRLEMMKTELNLSETQVKEVEKIYNETREEMQKLRQEFQGDRGGMRTAMREIWTDADKKIDALLDDGQKVKFEEYKAKREERMKQRRGQRGGIQ